jgi:hypothetical protein
MTSVISLTVLPILVFLAGMNYQKRTEKITKAQKKHTPRLCEDCDPGCPVCHGHCSSEATHHIFRTDIEDNTGVEFCDACYEDALEAGVFDTEAGRAV